MTEQEVKTDILWLQQMCSRRDAKYLRNLNRYMNNGQRRENIYELYNNPVAYYYMSTDADTGPWPIENVIKSCIDTKISKMSQVKVRPFLNPVNGKWFTRKVCRVGQQFFDEFYTKHRVYREAIDAYRDGQIFETGYVWLDEEAMIPKRIKPWEYYVDPAELNYGSVSRVLIRFWKYPMLNFREYIEKGTTAARMLERDKHAKAEQFHLYYDLDGGEKWTLADWVVVHRQKIRFEKNPVASIYAITPVKGMWSVSLVDELYTLQRELDVVNQKIHDATVLTPANLGLIPTVGGVKRSSLDAGREGILYEYEPVPGVSSPATWMTPAAVNDQLLKRRREIIEEMYNISGVSQLSAQSKKPSGLNSGVALDTLEDVESERHNREVQEYESFCMAISDIAIANFDGAILPSRAERAKVTWKDIKNEREFYSIQFSPASILSSTPKVKMEQIEKLQKMGVASPDRVAKWLEQPDLENVYSIATAVEDDVEAITWRGAEDHDFEYYEMVPGQMLLKNVVTELLRLDANEPENTKVIDNLVDFANHLKTKIDLFNQAATPPAPPPAAPPVATGQPANPAVPQAQPPQPALPTAPAA